MPSLGSSPARLRSSAGPSSRSPTRSESASTAYVAVVSVASASSVNQSARGPGQQPEHDAARSSSRRRASSAGVGSPAAGPTGSTSPACTARRTDPRQGVGRPRAEHRLDGDPARHGDVAAQRRTTGSRATSSSPPAQRHAAPRRRPAGPPPATAHGRPGDRDGHRRARAQPQAAEQALEHRGPVRVADEPVREPRGAGVEPARPSAPRGGPGPAGRRPAPSADGPRRRAPRRTGSPGASVNRTRVPGAQGRGRLAPSGPRGSRSVVPSSRQPPGDAAGRPR